MSWLVAAEGRERWMSTWNAETTRAIRRRSPPCELQWAEWVQRWEPQPHNILAHDVWRHIFAWIPQPWDLRLVARAFATVPPRCTGCRPRWSGHWPLYMVCAQHHNVARHRIRRSYVQPCRPTVRYDPEDGFVVIHAEEADGLVFEARRWYMNVSGTGIGRHICADGADANHKN